MSKIVVSGMAFDSGQSGIAEYILRTVELLAQKHSITIFTLSDDAHYFEKMNNCKTVSISSFWKRPLFNMLWHLFIFPFLVFSHKADALFLPAGNRRVCAFYPIKTVVTVHDLAQFHVDAKYDSFRMFYSKKVLPFFLRKADRFIAISQTTATDMEKFYYIAKERIVVSYNGFNNRVFTPERTKKDMKESYILYVARVEHPGKNHLNLVKAYELLSPAIKQGYRLICAGSLKERHEEVLSYVKSSADRERISFTGFVLSEKLPDLYRNASLFVFPSFFEGFGLPLIEAMACGTPVVSSTAGALHEVGGDAAYFIDPHKPEEMAEAMSTLLSDKKLREEFVEKGVKRASQFSWSRHVHDILNEMELHDE